jgi:hypothetical protein
MVGQPVGTKDEAAPTSGPKQATRSSVDIAGVMPERIKQEIYQTSVHLCFLTLIFDHKTRNPFQLYSSYLFVICSSFNDAFSVT